MLANAASQFLADRIVPADEEMAAWQIYADPTLANVTLAEDGREKSRCPNKA
jgi:hypothetical protein